MVLHMHGMLYLKENNFDISVESQVAKDLSCLADSPRNNLWVAVDGDKVIGSVGVIDRGNDIAQGHWFLLYPEYRGCGIAEKLLEEAATWCKRHGFKEVFLHTSSTQLAARKWYAKYGFTLSSSTPTKTFGVDIDAEKWVKKL